MCGEIFEHSQMLHVAYDQVHTVTFREVSHRSPFPICLMNFFKLAKRKLLKQSNHKTIKTSVYRPELTSLSYITWYCSFVIFVKLSASSSYPLPHLHSMICVIAHFPEFISFRSVTSGDVTRLTKSFGTLSCR